MLPVIGFVFDTANAIWYWNEGGKENKFMAICSMVSALPGIGDAIGVFGKGGKIACKIQKGLHIGGNAGSGILSAFNMENSFMNMRDSVSNGEGISFSDGLNFGLSVFGFKSSIKGMKNAVGTSYCFIAGTLVTTEDGQKPIEEIEVGDKVLSENELTGEVAVKTVTETYVNETDELVHIVVNGEEISATPTHPFYVAAPYILYCKKTPHCEAGCYLHLLVVFADTDNM
ncbi:MAG: polymorphic toxin-type HINT domain-containing protein [Oscillospiraceae bacterium]